MDSPIKKSVQVLSNPKMLACYLHWCCRYLGITPSIKIPGGKVIGFNSFSEYWGVNNGIPREEEIYLIKKNVEKGRIIFDIGANIGVYTIIFKLLCKLRYRFCF